MANSLDTALLAKVLAAKRVILQRLQGRLAPMDVVRAEVLRLVAENPATPTKEIARFLAIARPSATAFIDNLEQAKLIKRSHGAGDRREVRLTITPAGRAFMTSNEKKVKLFAKELFTLLDDKQKRHLLTIYDIILNSNNN
jgi:DNA-binding MarR family transcriptional regulator